MITRASLHRLLIISLALIAVLASPAAHADPPRVSVNRLIVGMPIYRPGDDGSEDKAFVTYLSQMLGVPVEIRMAEPYKEMPTLISRGQIDVAELPPLTYVTLKAKEPRVVNIATAVVSGNPTYLGHFYVRKDSKYQTLADLRGARIAYVNPQSTSGYLFPREVLRHKGFDPDHFFSSVQFIGSHPGVIASVLAGDVDVGTAEDITNNRIGIEFGRPDELRIIGKTERIPNDCFVARPGLDEGTIQRVTRALLDLHPADRRSAAILELMSINGWIPADETRYDRVRRVLEANKPVTGEH